ncbi:MAG: hypothetical protein ACUZ77_06710 [Candidatus Brocadiales bacterium]
MGKIQTQYLTDENGKKTAVQRNLRQASKAYLHTAIMLYIRLEARVSIWSDEKFGDSANIVCSLNRAIEHLLKLRLLEIDPLLLYPLPKKVEEYCYIKQIRVKNNKNFSGRIKDKGRISELAENASLLRKASMNG